MSRTLTATEPVVKVIEPGRSIIDQILELPLESIVMVEEVVEEVSPGRGHSFARSILHRTGISGWLITRVPSGTGTNLHSMKNGDYLHEPEVRAWAGAYNDRAVFTVLHEGRGRKITA